MFSLYQSLFDWGREDAVRVLVFGPTGAGKTTTIHSLCYSDQSDKPEVISPTIGLDIYKTKIGNANYRILDLGGGLIDLAADYAREVDFVVLFGDYPNNIDMIKYPEKQYAIYSSSASPLIDDSISRITSIDQLKDWLGHICK